MLFEILEYAGMQPSIISGAGLTRNHQEGKIGNAKSGRRGMAGDWSWWKWMAGIVQYHPEIGLLLNIDKDHQELMRADADIWNF